MLKGWCGVLNQPLVSQRTVARCWQPQSTSIFSSMWSRASLTSSTCLGAQSINCLPRGPCVTLASKSPGCFRKCWPKGLQMASQSSSKRLRSRTLAPAHCITVCARNYSTNTACLDQRASVHACFPLSHLHEPSRHGKKIWKTQKQRLDGGSDPLRKLSSQFASHVAVVPYGGMAPPSMHRPGVLSFLPFTVSEMPSLLWLINLCELQAYSDQDQGTCREFENVHFANILAPSCLEQKSDDQ